MNRRAFLHRFGIGVSAIAIAAQPGHAESHPDRFTFNGWDVRWSGWREPVNQAMTFGVWIAWPTSHHEPQALAHYATTLNGYGGRLAELAVMDTVWDHAWPSPRLMAQTAPQDRDFLKQRACRALLEHL